MINDMGISVHETAPDADDQTLSRSPFRDDDAAEAAAAALATVDSEFGRTTDPVRMYMREMGTVELLTREGELRIAKRIEDGLNQVLSALAVFPRSIETLVGIFDRVERQETRLTDVIAGFVDGEEDDPCPRLLRSSHPSSPRPPSTTRTASRQRRRRRRRDRGADTGPDPEDAARRVQLLRERYAVLKGS